MPATLEKPKKSRKGQTHAPNFSKQLLLESSLGHIVENKLSADATAKLVGVNPLTARNFLAKKVQEFSAANKSKFFAFAPRHAAAFNGSAERQLTILEQLNAKPLHLWDESDRKLERHALACIKAIHPFLQLAASVLPTTVQPLKSDNATGDSPTSDDDTEEITQDDGL